MRGLSIISALLLLAACGDDGASSTPDAAARDGSGLSFRDGAPSNQDGVRDVGAPVADGAADARRGGPVADQLTPDVLSPDVLPPDVLPADTLAHKCTSFAEFQCTPSTFVTCIAKCTDHKGRKLQLTCLKGMCICLVNGANKKSCPGGSSNCATCQQAFSCCDFPSL